MKYLCIPVHSISPAVLHQVHHYLVQELLHEGGADPEMFQCLRRDVGQLGLPAAIVTDGGVVVLAEENGRNTFKKDIYTKIKCICEFQRTKTTRGITKQYNIRKGHNAKPFPIQSVSGKESQVFDSQPKDVGSHLLND